MITNKQGPQFRVVIKYLYNNAIMMSIVTTGIFVVAMVIINAYKTVFCQNKNIDVAGDSSKYPFITNVQIQ